MCLGVPAQVVEVHEDAASGLKYAKAKIGGIVREVLIAFDEPLSPGDYVIVHVGVAIGKISEEEARETERLLAEIRSS